MCVYCFLLPSFISSSSTLSPPPHLFEWYILFDVWPLLLFLPEILNPTPGRQSHMRLLLAITIVKNSFKIRFDLTNFIILLFLLYGSGSTSLLSLSLSFVSLHLLQYTKFVTPTLPKELFFRKKKMDRLNN